MVVSHGLHTQYTDRRQQRSPYADFQPAQASWPQGLGLGKLQQPSGQVGAQMVQAGVHGVSPPSEVQVVGVIKGFLVGVLIRHLQVSRTGS